MNDRSQYINHIVLLIMSELSKANIISGSILIACVIIVAYFASQPHMWQDDSLFNWAAIAAILSFLLGLAIYSHQLHKKDMEERQRYMEKRQKDINEQKIVIRTLYGELYDNYVAITGEKHPINSMDLELYDTSAVFTSRYLYHDIYEGIINSGQIPSIRYELRQSIADIYIKIRMHNYYIKYVFESTGDDKSKSAHKNLFRCYKLLERDEKLLMAEIPTMIQKLKEFEASLHP